MELKEIRKDIAQQVNDYRHDYIRKSELERWQFIGQAYFVRRIDDLYYFVDDLDDDQITVIEEAEVYNILSLYRFYTNQDPALFNLRDTNDLVDLIRSYVYWEER